MKHISHVGDAGGPHWLPSRPSAAQFGSFWLAASLANKLMRLGTADPSHDFLKLAPKVWQFEGNVDFFSFSDKPTWPNNAKIVG